MSHENLASFLYEVRLDWPLFNVRLTFKVILKLLDSGRKGLVDLTLSTFVEEL